MVLDHRGRLLGTQVVGMNAGELLLPSILAIKNRYKLNRISAPVFPYPTLSETYRKAVAGSLAPQMFNPKVRRILRSVFNFRGRQD
jgi:hypothetical protein